ncbi:conserved hypothetical protein [Gammaproteobacteria bacterium]
MHSYVIVWDLDGCIADWAHRVPLLEAKDYDAFYAAMSKDEPIAAGAVIYNLLATQSMVLGHAIQEAKLEADIPFVDIITCRPEHVRHKTEKWMEDNGIIAPRSMHMRANNDNRPHVEIKMEIYRKRYREGEVLAVFDDSPEIVEAWRKAGVACYQVG